MDIFNAVSKQIDSTSSYGKEQVGSKTEGLQKVAKDTSTADTSSTSKKEDVEKIKKDLDNTVKKLNDQMDALSINIKFGFNDKIDTLFVDVTEKSSGKLIRKIPSEETMKLAEKMKEVIGMIFDKKG